MTTEIREQRPIWSSLLDQEVALGSKQASKESWSQGGQIFYTAGLAFGLDGELNTVCLGTETVVRAAVDNPKLQSGIPEEDAIIEMERRLKEGETNDAGNFKPKRPGAFRNRATGEIKRRTGYARQAAPRKRLSFRKAERQVPVLSGF